jgi:Zn-dependent protease with chaperone function
MGPFLGAILAAFLATLALDLGQVPDQVDRTTPTLLAVGMIAFAWASSRLHHAPPSGGRVPPPRWARPFDLIVYGWLLFATDWIVVARESTLDLPLLRQLMTLAPYILASLARVDASVPAEEEDAEPAAGAWTRSRIVGFHARLLLVPILPLLLINGVRDAARMIKPLDAVLAAYPVVEYGLFAALFVAAMIFMPRLLAWMLGSKRLPDGPLRRALEGDLARQNVRIGGIDEVDTGGMIANAAYLGLSTRLGRIFISDALLGVMPPDEIRAVFAHEVAHGTRRHLVWILLLFVGVMFVSYVASDLVAERTIRGLLGPDSSASMVVWTAHTLIFLCMLVPILGGLAAFVGISRKFEVEADLRASETLADPELFNRALMRVGMIAGKPIDRHGLRHFSIALRTSIVRACALDPAERERWRRKIRASKLAIAGLCVVVAAGVAWKAPADVELGKAHRALVAAGSGHPRSIPLLKESAAYARAALPHALARNHAAEIGIMALMALSDELLRRGGPGDFDEARATARDVHENWPAGDLTGDFNRMLLGIELEAIDPARDLADLRPGIKAAQDRLQELVALVGRNPSIDECEQELRFLAAAAGTGNGSLDYDADSFESSRLLALARGARLDGAESREAERALESWSNDAAWRRVVLERALGGRQPKEIVEGLVAAETRRTER